MTIEQITAITAMLSDELYEAQDKKDFFAGPEGEEFVSAAHELLRWVAECFIMADRSMMQHPVRCHDDKDVIRARIAASLVDRLDALDGSADKNREQMIVEAIDDYLAAWKAVA